MALFRSICWGYFPTLAETIGLCEVRFSESKLAASLMDISGQLTGLALPVAYAVLIGASGLALLRTGLLPPWFGWVRVVLGILLLSPLIYAVLPLGFLRTVVISLWLFAHSGQIQDAG